MNDSEIKPSVLLVDDDEVFRSRVAQAFRGRGYDVREAHDHASALTSARRDTPEFAVVDLRLPGESGLALVRDLRMIDVMTTIVVLTGYGSIATTLEAIRLGAVHYLTKPATVDDIIAGFKRAAIDAEESLGMPEEVPSLARVEWEHINRVLVDCNGNISQAARRLGLHRRSLQRKLSKHPVRR